MLRPTARGVIAAVLAVLLLVGADITGLTAGRVLAAALFIALAIGLVAILLSGIGLGLRRSVDTDAVTVGESLRVNLELVSGALLGRLPLGRAVVRQYLPAALGGHGDLALAPSMPHSLTVFRRGIHELGPCAVLVRDVLGMFHRRQMIDAPAQVIGLPAVEDVDWDLARSAGISQRADAASAASGRGEMGPIARRYATGDDIRRIHWKASARTGHLMTREEEPTAAESALIVLDTRRSQFPDEHVQDRVVAHAATAIATLRAHGYDVNVVEACGDHIVSTERQFGGASGWTGPSGAGNGARLVGGASAAGVGGASAAGADGAGQPTAGGSFAGTGTGSLVGREADAKAGHAALAALAGLGFEDDPHDSGLGSHRAAGAVSLALAIGPTPSRSAAQRDAAEEPFEGLELDRFAGRSPQCIAVGVSPAGELGTVGGALDAPADAVALVHSGWLGRWRLVEATTEASFADVLEALAGQPPAGTGTGVSSGSGTGASGGDGTGASGDPPRPMSEEAR